MAWWQQNTIFLRMTHKIQIPEQKCFKYLSTEIYVFPDTEIAVKLASTMKTMR